MPTDNYYMRAMVLGMIRGYQKTLSPDHGIMAQFTMHGCKFHPTCSQYTYEAIERYGIIKGVYLGSKRILRCNPLTKGGYDPVPR
jgi:putative membrane protein insertion efficiency factor